MLQIMDKFLFKFRFLVLVLILILGFYLRSNNLYTWPREGATFDEYAWTWLGISLIQNHVPESWSRHPQYTNRKEVIYRKADFTLVKPYLEHPPLFGIIAGSFALLSGVRDMYHVDLNHIRGLSLILGILSIFILYIFAAEVYDYRIGLLTSGIYSIVPTVVVGSRIVENENFFIPFFLLSLYLIAKFIKTKKAIHRNIAAIICGLLILAKIPWIAGAFSVVLILFYLRKYKDAFKFLAIVIPIFLVFFVYGFYFDSKLFLNLWAFQLQRYDIAFDSIFALFRAPYLVDRFLFDGWIFFGWLAIFLLMLKDLKKNYFIIIPFLAYFSIFVFAIPNEPGHGWYRYPFYPFLITSVALFLKEYFNKNYILTFFFLMFIGLSLLQLTWAQSFGFSYTVFRIFLILYGLSMLPLFFPKTKKFSFIASYLSLILILVFNTWTILNYNEQ